MTYRVMLRFTAPGSEWIQSIVPLDVLLQSTEGGLEIAVEVSRRLPITLPYTSMNASSCPREALLFREGYCVGSGCATKWDFSVKDLYICTTCPVQSRHGLCASCYRAGFSSSVETLPSNDPERPEDPAQSSGFMESTPSDACEGMRASYEFPKRVFQRISRLEETKTKG